MIADTVDLPLPIVGSQLAFRTIGITEVEVDHLKAAFAAHADRVNQRCVAPVATLGENTG